ncbi:hypothetical protein [Massilia soli]|uniref:DNA-binding protein n=1 Tax=Massilia soli TaxID=2792854 RepID=A0ABS7SRC7_9BURK|nr:hypothetical protein [Massilia soli]MBZ2208509.1 hypothetical protein [Massilia soli]
MSYGISWVKLEKYAEITGDSVDAVMARRKSGKWLDGEQCKIVDGRLWVNLRSVEEWIDGGGRANRTAAQSGEEESRNDVRAPAPVASMAKDALVPGLRKEEVLWDIATIALYLKREPQVVRERMACLPSFPKSIRLPTKTGRAQPLFLAEEVIAWTKKYKDKN